METNHEPNLDAVLDLYFNPALKPHAVANALGLPLLALARRVKQPDAQSGIADIAAFISQRNSHIAQSSVQALLAEAHKLPSIPASPTPAEHDRALRSIEITRRAADLLRKLSLPPATRRAAPALRIAPDSLPTPTSTPYPTSESPTDPAAMAPEAHETLSEAEEVAAFALERERRLSQPAGLAAAVARLRKDISQLNAS
jgi:hypothetical protein